MRGDVSCTRLREDSCCSRQDTREATLGSDSAAFNVVRGSGAPILRSVLAVVLGIVTLTALSFLIEALADPLLLRAFPHALPDHAALEHSVGVRTLVSAYGAACIAVGGYVSAWVAGRAPVRHALAMGLVQCALTLYAMHALTGVHAPSWVWITSAAMAVPAACIGGFVRFHSNRGDTRGSA